MKVWFQVVSYTPQGELIASCAKVLDGITSEQVPALGDYLFVPTDFPYTAIPVVTKRISCVLVGPDNFGYTWLIEARTSSSEMIRKLMNNGWDHYVLLA